MNAPKKNYQIQMYDGSKRTAEIRKVVETRIKESIPIEYLVSYHDTSTSIRLVLKKKDFDFVYVIDLDYAIIYNEENLGIDLFKEEGDENYHVHGQGFKKWDDLVSQLSRMLDSITVETVLGRPYAAGCSDKLHFSIQASRKHVTSTFGEYFDV